MPDHPMKNALEPILKIESCKSLQAFIPLVNSSDPKIMCLTFSLAPKVSSGYFNISVKVAKNTTQPHTINIDWVEWDMAFTIVFENGLFEIDLYLLMLESLFVVLESLFFVNSFFMSCSRAAITMLEKMATSQ